MTTKTILTLSSSYCRHMSALALVRSKFRAACKINFKGRCSLLQFLPSLLSFLKLSLESLSEKNGAHFFTHGTMGTWFSECEVVWFYGLAEMLYKWFQVSYLFCGFLTKYFQKYERKLFNYKRNTFRNLATWHFWYHRLSTTTQSTGSIFSTYITYSLG